MFFVLDVLAVVFFISSIISCRNKGFFKSFFGMIKVLLSLLVAYVFMPTIAYFYRTKFVEKLITENVAERINSLAQKTAEGFNFEKLFADMPAEFRDILTRYGADAEALSEKFGEMTGAAEESVTEMANSITASVVRTVSDVLAFVTLFIGCLIVLSIVIWIVGMILKLPVLSSLDKGLGFIFGIISGALLVWIFCNVAASAVELIGVIKPGLIGSNVIENTYIVKYVCDNFPFGFAAK